MGCVVNTMPWQFYPQERDLVPIVLGAGWAPWPVWTGAGSLAPHQDLMPGPSRHYADYTILAHSAKLYVPRCLWKIKSKLKL